MLSEIHFLENKTVPWKANQQKAQLSPIIFIPAIVGPPLLLGNNRMVNDVSLRINLIDEVLAVPLQEILNVAETTVFHDDHYFACK